MIFKRERKEEILSVLVWRIVCGFTALPSPGTPEPPLRSLLCNLIKYLANLARSNSCLPARLLQTAAVCCSQESVDLWVSAGQLSQLPAVTALSTSFSLIFGGKARQVRRGGSNRLEVITTRQHKYVIDHYPTSPPLLSLSCGLSVWSRLSTCILRSLLTLEMTDLFYVGVMIDNERWQLSALSSTCWLPLLNILQILLSTEDMRLWINRGCWANSWESVLFALTFTFLTLRFPHLDGDCSSN